MLEKPEKPVLFDVTEHHVPDHLYWKWYCWKSRFYLMSRNEAFTFLDADRRVGKAGFIWCHGTYVKKPRSMGFFNKLEKPVLFDVTEPLLPFNCLLTRNKLEKPVLFDVTEPIWLSFRASVSGWKSRFYLMSRNNFRFCLFYHILTKEPLINNFTFFSVSRYGNHS